MTQRSTTDASTGRSLRKPLLLTIVLGLLIGLGYGLVLHSSHSAAPAPVSKATPKTSTPAPKFDRYAHSLTDPASPWVIVNKQHPLSPISFVPELVDPPVATKPGRSKSSLKVSSQMAPALVQLFKAAEQEGLHLMLSSTYRSYQYQVGVYNRIVAQQGQASADEQSAKPGYSEHQTGLAADIAPLSGHCDLSQCFGTTPEGQWVAAHAYEYGFIVRYPDAKHDITGYEYEPWHIRYVGTELSKEMHLQGITTLEEFFSVTGGTQYN